MSTRIRNIIRRTKTGLDRQQLIEVVMTIGVVGMSFVLVALMILRLAGDGKQAAVKPEPKKEKPVDPILHPEIELGSFKITTTSLQRMAVGNADERIHILQFDASVMVQNGPQTQRVEKAFSRYEKRLQATVDSVTRNASQDELDDPNLDSLRGKIRKNVNRLLGGNVVDDVVVSDFRNYRL
jgi:hypothetical protein